MARRRILLLGAGDLNDETHAALEAAGAESVHLEDPQAEEVREALAKGVGAVGLVFIAGLALGSAAERVVVDGGTAHLRDGDGALERCPYPVAG